MLKGWHHSKSFVDILVDFDWFWYPYWFWHSVNSKGMTLQLEKFRD